MTDNNRWHPVHSDTYLVTGTRRQVGAIGIHENFQIETLATSSREAYVTVLDESYAAKYELVHVIAIKMKCLQCGECHVTVPPDLYL